MHPGVQHDLLYSKTLSRIWVKDPLNKVFRLLTDVKPDRSIILRGRWLFNQGESTLLVGVAWKFEISYNNLI
jgi:hypothetical protein